MNFVPEKSLLGVRWRCPVILDVNNKDLNFNENGIFFWVLEGFQSFDDNFNEIEKKIGFEKRR